MCTHLRIRGFLAFFTAFAVIVYSEEIPLPYQMAANYSEAMDGYSVLVMKLGKVVFEAYHNGATAETPYRLASGTKSFCGAIAAAAVQDGLLSLDEKVCDTIPEWRSDPRKSRITVRHLLSLTSGLEPGEVGRPPIYTKAVAAQPIAEPGEHFAYGPTAFQVFGELMTRKLKGESPVDYLKRRILNPIGLHVSSWRNDADGNPNMPSGAFLTAREWAKYGEFIRLGGKWDGKALVSQETLAACFKGSKANPAYGLSFWLGSVSLSTAEALHPGTQPKNDEKIPKDLVMAAGAGKQRLYIVPSMELVVVRQGEGNRFDDRAFLIRLLYGKTE